MYEYGVKALAGGKLTEGDEDLLMHITNDDDAEAIIEDIKSGEGYGRDYVIVRREVGEWNEV